MRQRWPTSPGRRRSAGWPARRAIDLTADSAILTAIANDIGTEAIFARQVIAYGRGGDALLALSTSGNSLGVLQALQEARRRGLRTIALVGYDGGRVAAEGLADRVIVTRSAHPAWPRRRPTTCSGSSSMMTRRASARVEGASRASAFAPSSTAWRARNWGATCSTTSAACCSTSRAAPTRWRASSRGWRPRRRRWRRSSRWRGRRCLRPAIASSGSSTAPGGRRRPVTPDAATCDDCLADLPRRSPLSLSVHQLHRLRPALHHRGRRALRPAVDDDGRVRHVRALPGGVRRSGRPPLPRAAQRLPRLRAFGAAGRRGRRRGDDRGRDAAARRGDRRGQGRGRLPTRRRWTGCARASTARTVRSRSWRPTWRRPRRSSSSGRPRPRCCAGAQRHRWRADAPVAEAVAPRSADSA